MHLWTQLIISKIYPHICSFVTVDEKEEVKGKASFIFEKINSLEVRVKSYIIPPEDLFVFTKWFFLGYKITPYRDLKRPSGLKRSSSLRTPRGRRDSGSNESGKKCMPFWYVEIWTYFDITVKLSKLNTWNDLRMFVVLSQQRSGHASNPENHILSN